MSVRETEPAEYGDPRTRRRFLGEAGATAVALAAPSLVAAAPRPDGPNIVLIIVDTLRADHSFGKRARTPNIDALARQGLSFTRCYPEAMPTIPARRSIMSGRRVFPFHGWHPYPGLLAEPGWAPLRDSSLAFTSILRRAGYWTAYVTDNTGVGFSPPWGRFRHSFDRFVRRGGQFGGRATGVSERELRHWLPPQIEDAETRDRVRRYLANGRYSHDETKSFAARVFRDGARVLEQAKRQRPFALVVDTFEPHEPWTPPRKYVNMYGDPDYHGPEPARPYYAPVSRYLSEGEARVLLPRMRALYAAEVTMTDRWLGVFLDKLHDLRLERETVVMLVSDHGFFLGDHGLTGKIASRLHPELIHVPLILVDPERRHAGRESRYFCSTHDVAPTLLSMAGVRVPRGMDGVDLSRFLRGKRPPARDYAWGGYGNSFFVHTDNWSLFGHNHGGDLHLYNARRDRHQFRNLTGSHPGKARELRRVVRRKARGGLPVFPY
jgi:arylsulfatase A-like enzyme